MIQRFLVEIFLHSFFLEPFLSRDQSSNILVKIYIVFLGVGSLLGYFLVDNPLQIFFGICFFQIFSGGKLFFIYCVWWKFLLNFWWRRLWSLFGRDFV